MTPDQRVTVMMARTTNYYHILRTALWMQAGVAAVIHFGPPGHAVMLALVAVAAASYGMFAGGTALRDVGNLAAGFDAQTAATKYGRVLQARKFPMLIVTNTVFMAAVGAAQLYAIFW